MSGRIIPAPLAAAPIVTSPPPGARAGTRRPWARGRWCRSAVPKSRAAVRREGGDRRVDPRAGDAQVDPLADRPGAADGDLVRGASPRPSAARRAISWASSSPGEPVAAFALPALTTTARRRERSSAPVADHRRRRQRARRVHQRRDDRAVGGEDAEVRAPEGFSPHATPAARKPGGEVVTEPPASGSSPSGARQPVAAGDRAQSRPSVSGSPAIRLRFWTAWPAAPLPRLSITPNTVTRPPRGSTIGHTCA